MHDGDRKLARLAAKMLEAWRQHASEESTSLPALPLDFRDRVMRLYRLLARAIGLQRPLAAARLRRELSEAIGGDIQQLHQLRDRLTPSAEIMPEADDVFSGPQGTAQRVPAGELSSVTRPGECNNRTD